MAPQIPKTYKAAIFKEKGGPLVVEEIETKQPQEGEVLIKVQACGICHAEVFTQQALMPVTLYTETTMLPCSGADVSQPQDSWSRSHRTCRGRRSTRESVEGW